MTGVGNLEEKVAIKIINDFLNLSSNFMFAVSYDKCSDLVQYLHSIRKFQ